MLQRNKSASPPRVHHNAAWNCAGSLGDALIGIVMVPFVVHALGDTTYGLWALIAALTGCFGFLDLGIRGALGRQLAFHLARRDTRSINTTLNTALVLLCAVCMIAIIGVLGLQFLFFRLFAVPPEQDWAVRIALLLAGANLAVSFPLSAFDATLWAAQRFDRLNQIDILVSVLKAALLFLFLQSPAALICLPLISLGGSLLAGLLKIVVTWTAIAGLRIGLRSISRGALGDLFAFGIWNFVGSVVRLLVMRIPAVVIGAFMGPAAVTPYAVAEKILSTVTALFAAATGVLTPKSAGYSALDDGARQRGLFVHGGRLCWALAVFAALGMCFFGQPVIVAWLGPKYPQAPVYLAITALGAIVPLSQSMSSCVLLGIARHQFLAVIAVAQVVLAVVLALLAAAYGDAAAVCAALAIVSTMAGLATAWHGCRALHVPLMAYTREAVAPAIAACVVPAMAGAAMTLEKASFFPYAFVAHIVLFSLLFAASLYWTCLRPTGSPLWAQGSSCEENDAYLLPMGRSLRAPQR